MIVVMVYPRRLYLSAMNNSRIGLSRSQQESGVVEMRLNPIQKGRSSEPIALWLTVGAISMVAPFARIQGLAAGSVFSAQPLKPASCVAPEFRQFDFWVGDWDGFEVDKTTIVAHAQVDRVLDGCVLLEQYEGTDGLKGQSFSLYDTSRRIWHQTWVTNRGQLLVVEGKIQAGEMVLSGVDHAAGRRILVRGTWKPVKGGVRETAVTSTDGGKTWQAWFDLLFRPHKM